MRKILILVFTLFLPFIACDKQSDQPVFNPDQYYLAQITGYDLNCSNCILNFPNDSLTIKKGIGESPGNFYSAVNFYKENFQIGQKLKVKLRKTANTELRACITMYLNYNYKSIFVIDYKFVSE